MIVRAWIVGSITVKAVALVAVPPGVVTAIGPVVARAGTVAVILVSETTMKVDRVPLNLTAEAPVKPVPMIVTDVPGPPIRIPIWQVWHEGRRRDAGHVWLRALVTRVMQEAAAEAGLPHAVSRP